MKPIGYLSLVLHAHLPFVRHPEYPEFMEEDWLYEAITETYVPLLQMMERLTQESIPFALTMSMTPPLCEMLADPMLQQRYVERLEKLIVLSARIMHKHRNTPYHDASEHVYYELRQAHEDYTSRWKRDLIGAFRKFQDQGSLSIITCPATHGYLPLMATDESRQAQIEIGARNYHRHFGRRPRGIWLSECAYAPGMEYLLRESGIQFFFVESHGITEAHPTPPRGTTGPIQTHAGVYAFGRDKECSHQVWSAEQGYPGDYLYRELYRDAGYDLTEEELGDCRHPDGIRRNLGLKYHRITGKVSLSQKQAYVPNWAKERAAFHAGDFLHNRQRQCGHIFEQHGYRPHLTAPYDAELFGHWWYEGPMFLEFLFRKAAFDQDQIQLITQEQYLQQVPEHHRANPALSSWGAEGYYQVWLNETNAWIYPHLHHIEESMIASTVDFSQPSPYQQRLLQQMARELVLAQSSDWAFIMTQETTVPYAVKRTRDHIHRFHKLHHALYERTECSELAEWESRDNIFPEIDPHLYHPSLVKHPNAGNAVWTVS